MKKLLDGAFTLLIIFLAMPYVLSSLKGSYSIANNNPSFVKPTAYNGHKHSAIIRLHDSSGRFFCSGFVVSDDYAITAGHCVEGQIYGLVDEVKIFNEAMQDTGVVASGAAANRRGDTGMLKGNFKDFDKFLLITDAQKLYTIMGHATVGYSMGYPYGGAIFMSAVKPLGSENFHIAGEAMLYPGMSGGPLVTEDGTVVGINSYVNGNHCAFASLIDILDSFQIKHD